MEEIKIKLGLDILKKDIALFFLLFASFFAIFFFITLFLSPKYPVSSSIIVEEKDNSMSATSITMMMSGQSQKIMNEIEILKSRTIFDEIIKELNLTYKIERENNTFINYIFRILTGRSPVEGSIYAELIPEKLKSVESLIVVDQKGYLISNSLEEKECFFESECDYLGEKLLLRKLGEISSGVSFKAKFSDIVKRREGLTGEFSFSTIGDTKESNIFQIIMSSSEPFLAVKIVDAFDRKYVSKKLEWNSADADDQQKFMSKILDDVKKELDEKSNRLAIYQKENMTVLPDLQFTEIMKRNVEIEKEIAILKLQEEIVQKYNESINIEERTPVPAPVVIDDLSVQMTVRTHNELLIKHTAMSANLTENHPQIAKLESDIRQARINLKDLLKKSVDNYQKSIAILKNQSSLIFSTIENLPKNLMNIADLQREVLITEKLYAFLAQKIYEARITQTVEIAPIRILDNPSHLVKKSFPSFSISIIIIFALSFFLSVVFFILYEALRKSVFSKYEFYLTAEKNEIFEISGKVTFEKYINDFISLSLPVNSTATIFSAIQEIPEIQKISSAYKNGKKIHCFDISSTKADVKPGKIEDSFIRNDLSPVFSHYTAQLDHVSAVSVIGSEWFREQISKLSTGQNSAVILIIRNIEPDTFSGNIFINNTAVIFYVKVNGTERSYVRSMRNVINRSSFIKKILIAE